MKVWNINVRYHMDEDPKVLLSAGLPLMPGKCYQHLAWGPDGLIAGGWVGWAVGRPQRGESSGLAASGGRAVNCACAGGEMQGALLGG